MQTYFTGRATIDKNLIQAVFYCCGYGLLTTIATLCVKVAAPHTSDSMIVFFRFTVSIIYIAVIFAIQYLRGKSFSLTTKKPGLHLLRASAAFLCQFTLFYALQYIPLMDGNLLFMTNPLFVPIVGAIFLGTRSNYKNWLAIILGFIGVTLLLKPGHELFNPAALIALSSGLFAAISILGVHELSKSDSVHTIMFYYFSITFVISAIAAVFNWQTPDMHTLISLLIIGVLLTLAQECSIRALVHAPAKIVAPLLYITIVFSGLFDWIVWRHIPDLLSWCGMITVFIASTLTVVFANQKKSTAKVSAGSSV